MASASDPHSPVEELSLVSQTVEQTWTKKSTSNRNQEVKELMKEIQRLREEADHAKTRPQYSTAKSIIGCVIVLVIGFSILGLIIALDAQKSSKSTLFKAVVSRTFPFR